MYADSNRTQIVSTDTEKVTTYCHYRINDKKLIMTTRTQEDKVKKRFIQQILTLLLSPARVFINS